MSPFVQLSRDHLLHLDSQVNSPSFFMVEAGLCFEPDRVLESGCLLRSWELDVSLSNTGVCFKYNFNAFYFVKLMTVAKVHSGVLGSGGLGLKTQEVPATAQGPAVVSVKIWAQIPGLAQWVKVLELLQAAV